ncbi:MAG: SusC/RagA family TonB-linked outer membrane protein [Gemmatimonadota bacterium]
MNGRLVRLLSLTLLALSAIALQATSSLAQDAPYLIQGRVEEPSGRPLPDVQVALAGTPYGAITDAEGRFALRADVDPGDYVLEYRLLGRETITQSIALGAERALTPEVVSLAETAIEMDEVVVTVAGTETERARLGNAVETVSGEEVAESAGASALDAALQGKVTGAVISEHSGQPGGGVSVRLRGTSSILGGAEPLYVIDGVIVDNSSEALIGLGSNATRGNASLTNRMADIPPEDVERIEVLKGAAAAALYGSRANNGVIQIFTRSGRVGEPRITFTTQGSLSETPDTYDLLMVPRAGRGDVAARLADSLGVPVQRFDIQDRIFRTGLGTTNRLSVSGGSEATTYYLAGSYTNEEGILETTDYERINVRANLTQLLFERLSLRANANYIDSDANFIPEGEQTQGVLTSVIFTPTSFDPFFDAELGRFPYNPILQGNPLDVLANWQANEDVDRFLGSVEADLRVTDALSVRGLFGMDDYRLENTYLQPPLSISPSFTGSIQNPIRLSRQITSEATATHEAALGSAGLATLVGVRFNRDRAEVIRAAAEAIPPQLDVVSGATQFASQSIVELDRFGIFGQEQVGFGDRLFLTGGLNLEASSAFSSEERWQLFPRLGVSYLIDREPFWSESAIGDVVSTLKLRAAYGETGGQPPGAYDRFDNYVNAPYAGRPGLVASIQAGNANLQPEREREIEGGIELGLLDDRVGLDLTYYDDKTTDLILAVPLPPSTGSQTQFQNIGTITNRGVEAALNTVNVQTPGFGWRTRVQLAHNASNVEELVTAADTLFFGYLNAVIEGEPVGVFVGNFYACTPEGEIALNENGIPFRERVDGVLQRRVLGDPNPNLTASLLNTFDVGANLQLSLLLDGRFGNDVANFSRRISEFFGADAIIAREIEGEVPTGFYSRNGERIQTYEEYVEDGSFVKLREAAVRYRIEAPLVRSFGARDVVVTFAGRNLATWTDYSGLDPEINLFSANTVAQGVDFATTPIPRSFLLGLTFSF